MSAAAPPQPLTTTPPAPATPAAGPRPFRFTAEQFNELGSLGWFADRRVLLIDGVVLEQGPMNPPHAVGLELVTEAVRRAFPTGHSFRVQVPLHADEFSDPRPDLAVVPGGPRDYLAGHPRAAVLVVEVADSTLDFDLTVKAERYATAGVADYWVLDLAARGLHVLRGPQPLPAGLGATAYRTHATLTAADAVAPLAAPAAVIPVADLLP